MGMQNNSGESEGQSREFYRDMRFWLILFMLSAFLVFTLIRYPG